MVVGNWAIFRRSVVLVVIFGVPRTARFRIPTLSEYYAVMMSLNIHSATIQGSNHTEESRN